MDSGSGFLAGDLLFLKDLHHDVLVYHGYGIVEVGLVALGGGFKLGGHSNVYLIALGVALERLHVDKIDELDLLARLYGNDYRADGAAEFVLELFKHAVKVRVVVIVLIDEEYLRYAYFAGIIPCKLGADLNAGLGVNKDNSAARNAESLLYFAYKVKVSGGIENIYLATLPDDGRYRRRYRKASLDLFGVKVANGISV